MPDAGTPPRGTRSPTAAEKHDHLSQSVLFAGLTPAEMKTFEDLTAMATCRRGQLIHAPWESPNALILLKRGSVRLTKTDDDGRQLTVAILDPGAVFGESALLGQSSAGVGAEALDECLICTVPTDQMRELIQRFPRIGLNLLEHIGDRLRRAHELSQEVAFWNVQRRLANQIAMLAERYGRPTLGGHVMVNRTFTQTDLAEMVGATRQTVSEIFASMERLGIVARRRRRIVILDAEALDRFGRPEGADR